MYECLIIITCTLLSEIGGTGSRGKGLKGGGNKCKGWALQLQSQSFEVREVTGHGDMVDTAIAAYIIK